MFLFVFAYTYIYRTDIAQVSKLFVRLSNPGLDHIGLLNNLIANKTFVIESFGYLKVWPSKLEN